MMSFSVVQVTSDSYLLTTTVSIVLLSMVSFDESDGFPLMATASILLSSSKISQLTNVHN